jgi:hypothetical protein
MQSGHPEADTALAASRTFLEQANALKLLSGYESKIMRALEKHQAQLKSLQTERKAAYEKAVEQATQFEQLAEAMEETYKPGEDFEPASAYGGFAFSGDGILRRRERAAHLRVARIYHFRGQIADSGAEAGRQDPASRRIIASAKVKIDGPATSHTKRVFVRQGCGLSIPTSRHCSPSGPRLPACLWAATGPQYNRKSSS